MKCANCELEIKTCDSCGNEFDLDENILCLQRGNGDTHYCVSFCSETETEAIGED